MKHTNSMKAFLFFIFMGFATLLLAQSPIETSLKKYQSNYLPEKVFVHTDKNIYAGGEVVWMAVYLMEGLLHTPNRVSQNIKLELRNVKGEVILKQIITSKEGHSAGDFSIPVNLNPGTYQIVAYSNYQMNSDPATLFKKNIQIIAGLKKSATEKVMEGEIPSDVTASKKTQARIRFFPEGGECVSGITCQIAYTIHSIYPTNAFIIDSNGKRIIELSPNEYGVGRFRYLPKADEDYWVVFEGGSEKIAVPKPLQTGYHLNIKNKETVVKILATTNFPIGMQGARLVLHQRGIYLVDKKITLNDSYFRVNIPREALAPGVIVCTLFDPQDNPVAERLFFITPKRQSTLLQLSTNKSTFETREEAKLQIITSSEDATTIDSTPSRLSISIIPEQAYDLMSGDDLRTWILLNSDVDQIIPDAPKLVFPKNEIDSRGVIDDFMLTRGWRRFRWETILSKEKFTPKHILKQGVYLQGQMVRFEDPDRPRPGKVFLTRLKNAYIEEVMTDENGYFSFGPYQFSDTINVFLQGRFKMGKRNRLNPEISLKDNPVVKLKILEDEIPDVDFDKPLERIQLIKESIDAYQKMSQNMLNIAQSYDSLYFILPEIDVTEKRRTKIEKSRESRTHLYGTPTNRLVVQDNPSTRNVQDAVDLFRQIPGIQVSGSGNFGDQRLVIRGASSIVGSNDPLILLDGFPVDLSFFQGYPVADIEFIDVLKGAEASIYGSRGATGVILVYTNSGISTASDEPGVLSTKIIGFYKAREFAVFDSATDRNSNRPDIRTTLHWNPILKTNEKGEAKDLFKTSDQYGKFIIIAQGLKDDGTPLFGTTQFEVKN